MRRMFPMLHRGLPCCERQAYCLQVYQGHDVAVAARGVKRIESFGTQECSNTAWAFAKMHLRQASVLGHKISAAAGCTLFTLPEQDQRVISARLGHRSASVDSATRRGPEAVECYLLARASKAARARAAELVDRSPNVCSSRHAGRSAPVSSFGRGPLENGGACGARPREYRPNSGDSRMAWRCRVEGGRCQGSANG
eukprot:s3024_g4.t1